MFSSTTCRRTLTWSMIVAALHPAAKFGLSASNTPPSIRSVRQPLPDSRMRTMPPPIAVTAPSSDNMLASGDASPSTSQTVGSKRIRRSAAVPSERPKAGRAKPHAALNLLPTAAGLLQISNACSGAAGSIVIDNLVTIAFSRRIIEMRCHNAHPRLLTARGRCSDQFFTMACKAIGQLTQRNRPARDDTKRRRADMANG